MTVIIMIAFHGSEAGKGGQVDFELESEQPDLASYALYEDKEKAVVTKRFKRRSTSRLDPNARLCIQIRTTTYPRHRHLEL